MSGDLGRSPQRDAMERMQALPRGEKGAQGNQGNRGERGDPGLSGVQRKALAYLFLLNLLITAAAAWGGLHAIAAIHQQARVSVEQRCAALEQVIAIPVPPVKGVPSRQWEAAFETIQRHLAAQLGCRQLPAAVRK